MNWTVEMIDALSAPASSAEKSLDRLEKKLTTATAASDKFDKASKRSGKGAKEADSILKSFGTTIAGYGGPLGIATGGLKLVGEAAFAVGEAVVTAAYGFAKFAVDTLAFKESTLETFRLILGTKREAKEFFQEAALFGKFTPFETGQVVDAYKTFLSAGFSQQEVPIVFQAASDVAAASGFDPEIFKSLGLVFAQIKGLGHLAGDDLRQLNNSLSKAGVGLGEVLGTIGKNMKVDPKMVKGLISQGAVGSDVAIFSVLEAIKNKGGGKLGETTLAQSQTLRGLFSTLNSTAQDTFLNFDLDEMPGLTSFKGFIVQLIGVFDTSTPAGARLASTVKDITNDLLGLFGKVDGETMSKWLMRTLDLVDDVRTFLRGIDWETVGGVATAAWQGLQGAVLGFWDAVKPALGRFLELLGLTAKNGDLSIGTITDAMTFLGVAIGNTLGLFLDLASAPARFVAELEKMKISVVEGAVGIGRAISDGIGQGLSGAAKAVFGAAGFLAGGVTDTISSTLAIQSPSKVMRMMGLQVGAGLALGMMGSMAQVEAASAGLAEQPIAALPAGVGARSTNVSLTIPITINDARDAQAVARQLEEVLPSHLAVVFQRLAAESGS